jgi:hypothetical protein
LTSLFHQHHTEPIFTFARHGLRDEQQANKDSICMTKAGIYLSVVRASVGETDSQPGQPTQLMLPYDNDDPHRAGFVPLDEIAATKRASP